MFHYFIIYKPYLVLSQFSPEENKQTLADFFPVPKDVYPVGRLDYDSEGLLLLTNDKLINNRLLHPVHKHEREYWVQVDGAITPNTLQQLQTGVTITIDSKLFTAKAFSTSLFNKEPNVPERIPSIRFRKNIPAPWIKIILTEGKNRQVRKMLAATGFPVLRLIRYRIAKLTLQNMQPGDMISLDKKLIYKKLFNE